MGNFWAWAQANPLAAIALLSAGGGAVSGLVIALGKAAPNLTQLVKAVRGKNGNGHAIKQADPPGERTAEGRKDLAALGAAATPDEVAVVRAGLAALELRITGPGGIQERVAIVEETCSRTEKKVDELPARFAEEVKKQRDAEKRDLQIGGAWIVLGALRRQGVLPERRKSPTSPRPPGVERRGAGDGGPSA